MLFASFRATTIWIIAIVICFPAFIPCLSAPSMLEDPARARHHQKLFHSKIEHRKIDRLGANTDTEFQAGDFAGDYQLLLGEESVDDTTDNTNLGSGYKRRKQRKLYTLRKLDDLDIYDDANGEIKSNTLDGVTGDVNDQSNEEKDRRDNAQSLPMTNNFVETLDGETARSPWEMPGPVVVKPGVNEKRPEEFDDPPDTGDIGAKVQQLETEIRQLEKDKGIASTDDPNATGNGNLTLNTTLKPYKNLTDVNTMELKYEVAGKHSFSVEIIIFMVIPAFLVIFLLYLAITLYWTKCWFWKVVPPDRFYQFEHYEIEQDEDPSDLAPLLKTPLEALHDAEMRDQARLEAIPEQYRNTDTSGDEADGNQQRRHVAKEWNMLS